MVLGTSYALASPSIKFRGTYSYCDAIDAIRFVSGEEAHVIARDYDGDFEPEHSICVGGGPASPGNLEVSGATIRLTGAKHLVVLGKHSASLEPPDRLATVLSSGAITRHSAGLELSDIVATVLEIVNAENPDTGLYVENGGAIRGEIETPGEQGSTLVNKIRLVSRLPQHGTEGVSIAVMKIYSSEETSSISPEETSSISLEGISLIPVSRLYSLQGISLELETVTANDVAALVIGSHSAHEMRMTSRAGSMTTYLPFEVTGKGPGHNLVILDPGDGKEIAFEAAIRDGVRVVVLSGTPTFTGELTGAALQVTRGIVRLGQDGNARTDAVVHLHHVASEADKVKLHLVASSGASPSIWRTLKGLQSEESHAASGNDKAPTVFGRGNKLALDVDDGAIFTFHGDIEDLKGFDKLGPGKQVLTGRVRLSSATVDKSKARRRMSPGASIIGLRESVPIDSATEANMIVNIRGGELAIDHDTFPAGTNLFIFKVTRQRLIVRAGPEFTAENPAIFASHVIGGDMVKTGSGVMKISSTAKTTSNLWIQEGAVILGGQDPLLVGTVGIHTNAKLSLSEANTIIGGLRSFSDNKSGIVEGHSRDDRASLTLNVMEDKAFVFDGDIKRLTHFIKKGKGAQELNGKVYFISHSSNTDPVVDIPISVGDYELPPGLDVVGDKAFMLSLLGGVSKLVDPDKFKIQIMSGPVIVKVDTFQKIGQEDEPVFLGSAGSLIVRGAGTFSNDVFTNENHNPDAGRWDNDEPGKWEFTGILVKIGQEELKFTGILANLLVDIREGSAVLEGADVDVSTSEFAIAKNTFLDLGGVSRTIGGLSNSWMVASETAPESGDRIVRGGGSGDIELILDVPDGVTRFFDGKLEDITGLSKKGAGTQKLAGESPSFSKPVRIYQGALEVQSDYLKETEVVFETEEIAAIPGLEADEIAPPLIAIPRLIVRNDGDREQVFNNVVTSRGEAKGALVKSGARKIRFTRPLSMSEFHLRNGEASFSAISDAVPPKLALQAITRFDRRPDDYMRAVLYLDGSSDGISVISGLSDLQLRSGSASLAAKRDVIAGAIEFPAGAKEILRISVPDNESSRSHADIRNVRKIVMDGKGEQVILGRVTRDAGIAASEAILEVKEEAKARISLDTFKNLDETPLLIEEGGVLFVEGPMDEPAVSASGETCNVAEVSGVVYATESMPEPLMLKHPIHGKGLLSFAGPSEQNFFGISTSEGERYESHVEIHNVTTIILDGEGEISLLGRVARHKSSEDDIGDLTPILTVKKGVKAWIKADIFKKPPEPDTAAESRYVDLASYPIYVAEGGSLFIDDPEDGSTKLRNHIYGDGVVYFKGAKGRDNYASSRKVMRARKVVLGLDEDLDLATEDHSAYSGLVSSDENVVLRNSHGEPGHFVVDVDAGASHLFEGRLGDGIHFRKKGHGTQRLKIADGDNARISHEKGSLVMHVQAADHTNPTSNCVSEDYTCVEVLIDVVPKPEPKFEAGEAEDCEPIKSLLVRKREAEAREAENAIHLRIVGMSHMELTNRLNLHDRARVSIERSSDADQNAKLKVIYSNNEELEENDAEIALKEGISLLVGKDTENPGRLPANVNVPGGAEVGGNGAINGIVTLVGGGVLSPGHSIGRTELEELALEDEGYVKIEIEHLGGNDWQADSIAPIDEDEGLSIPDGVGLILAKVGTPPDELVYSGEKVIVENYKDGRFISFDASSLGFKNILPVINYQEPIGGSGSGNVSLSWDLLQIEKFGLSGTTSNQKAVGDYIDRISESITHYHVKVGGQLESTENHPSYDFLLALPEGKVPVALNLFSGEIYSLGVRTFIEGSGILDKLITRHIQEVSTTDRVGSPFCEGEAAFSREDCRATQLRFQAWGRGFLGYSSVDEDYYSPNVKVDKSSSGGILGLDMVSSLGRFGLVLSSVTGSYGIEEASEGASRSSEGNFGSYHVDFYGTHQFMKDWEIIGRVGIGSHNSSVSRELSFKDYDFSEDLSGEHSALGLRLMTEVAKADVVPLRGLGFEGYSDLFFALGYARLSSSSFSEEVSSGDGDMALSVSPSSYDVLDSTLGVRGALALCFDCIASSGFDVQVSYLLGIRANLINEDPDVKLSFVSGSSGVDPYVSSAASFGPGAGVFGLGFALKPVPGLAASFSADGVGEVSTNGSFNGAFSLRAIFNL